MAIYKLQDLLPETYEQEDIDGHLKTFLDAFQATLEKIHEDELSLRLIQGIFTTPVKYLKYIARSLGWQLQSQDEDEKRNECSTIIDYYDLKGTPYGIRLISHLSFDKFFEKIGEAYTETAESSSEIVLTPPTYLAKLLNEEGDFVDTDWDPATGGTGYGYDPLYSYFIFIRVDPDDYTFGDLTPRVKAFMNIIQTMHPAGRYCYPYIYSIATRDDQYAKIQKMNEEIIGHKFFDDEGHWDDGGFFDVEAEPIDPSASSIFLVDIGNFDDLDDEATPGYKHFDDLDDEATPGYEHFDDGIWQVHAVMEVS